MKPEREKELKERIKYYKIERDELLAEIDTLQSEFREKLDKVTLEREINKQMYTNLTRIHSDVIKERDELRSKFTKIEELIRSTKINLDTF